MVEGMHCTQAIEGRHAWYTGHATVCAVLQSQHCSSTHGDHHTRRWFGFKAAAITAPGGMALFQPELLIVLSCVRAVGGDPAKAAAN